MLSYAADERLRHPVVLFYANRYLEDAAFIDALWKLERANPRFRFVPTLTRVANNNGWKGKIGTHQLGNAAHTRGNLARPDLLHSWAANDGCGDPPNAQ
jgi:NAD(P)H-flavin reductase